jgi:hypothetical protein
MYRSIVLSGGEDCHFYDSLEDAVKIDRILSPIRFAIVRLECASESITSQNRNHQWPLRYGDGGVQIKYGHEAFDEDLLLAI